MDDRSFKLHSGAGKKLIVLRWGFCEEDCCNVDDNIIADGSLSFTKELADGLIEMASKHCRVFIARTFTRKLPIMRIADNFPQPENFKIPPTKTVVFEDYSFYIWQF